MRRSWDMLPWQRRLIWTLLVALCASVSAGCLGFRSKPRASFLRSLEWAEGGVWLKADTHIHTRFSDGSLGLGEVVKQGRAHGCEVLAITDHGDSKFQATSEEYFVELNRVRRENRDLILLAGLDWNVPPWQGREQATLVVPPGPHERKFLRDFQALFDDNYDDKRDPEAGLAALRWLQANSYGTSGMPVVFYNHPSRKIDNANEFEACLARWHSHSSIAVGFEGAPGHQDSEPIGGYSGGLQTIDRWDPAAADIGGAWDRMLQQGLPIWGALATSDF